MVGIRIAMFVYCLAVVLGCGWYLGRVIRSLSVLQPKIAKQAMQLQELQSHERELSQIWQSLDTKQRRERGGYDGPEAVDASFETQQAQEALDQAKALSQVGKTQLAKSKDQQRQLARWLTPLIVLVLIHLIGIVGLWPKQTSLGQWGKHLPD